ncbi:MAG: hypothetical protein ACKVY0_01720 [Prosthecobacter sp.]|uniref:hypothetical protein n=1 Tax=Prosthecobacter sp. TaxID=1965333 RepID=UPI0038FF1F59
MNEFSELNQLLEPSRPCFTVETANNLLKIVPDETKLARMEVLAAKANEGRLTHLEEREYWSLICAGKFMSILRLQAKVFLKRAAA